MKRELKEFQELMHWNNEELIAQFHYAICVSARMMAEIYLEEDAFAHLASEYNDASFEDFYNYGVSIGLL